MFPHNDDVLLMYSCSPVNVTKFLSDSLRVMSASDDKTARVWDIATEAELIKYEEHTVSCLKVRHWSVLPSQAQMNIARAMQELYVPPTMLSILASCLFS